MVLSLNGWLSGISASMVVISGLVIGLFCFYKSRKTNARLLFYMGIIIFSFCFPLLGEFIDLLTILTTGNNMDNSYGLHGLIVFAWTPVLGLCIAYFAVELLDLKKKWYILSVMIILCVLAEIALFIDPLGSINFMYPEHPGEDLIDNPLAYDSILSLLLFIIIIFTGIFCVFAMLYKGIQSEGILRKKFLLLALGAVIVMTTQMPDAFFGDLGVFFFFSRTGTVIGCWMLYLALREEAEKEDKKKITKEIKVKGDLFRISKYKREDITEEEVSISKEKKICLVCKGRVSKFEVFLCDCDAFYCHKCAKALIDMENVCWACGEQIDKSKPTKAYEDVEKEEFSAKIKPHKENSQDFKQKKG